MAARLHLGRLPEALRTQLESEGRILYLAENIGETAICKDYRAPGARSGRRWIWFIGYFVLTERRVVAKARWYHRVDVNVAYDEPLSPALAFHVKRKYLCLAWDASAQDPRTSGQLEVRLYLPDVTTAARLLEQAGARIEWNGR